MMAPPLPEGIRAHPRLDQWLGVGADGDVLATSGKVDIGQGISHALRLIVAAELGLPPHRITMRPASTLYSPDEAVTSGSLSVQQSGLALRLAAAHLREACRSAMARRHARGIGDVSLHDGVFRVRATDQAATYQQLADAALLAQAIDPAHLASGGPAAGTGESARPDVAAKVFGEFRFIHDLRWPDMVYGQVFRPPTLQARIDENRLARLLPALSALSGVVHVLRDGLLIGVLARSEWALSQAVRCVQRHEADGPIWTPARAMPDLDAWQDWLALQPTETTVVLERPGIDAPADADARTGLRADYGRPYLQHASIGLCCAIARWQPDVDALEVWTHSQGIFNLRRDLALAFAVQVDAVRVSHVEGAGCYGHNGADDVAFDAAWLARAARGQPVRVQWTREAELGHAPLGPAMTVTVEAEVDGNGRLRAWTQDVRSQGHGTRPGRGASPSLLGAWQTADPFPVPMAVNAALSAGGGSERNAVPPYAVPALAVRNHRILSMPVRVSALRALGAHANVFAAESMMDELASRLSMDPLAFRLAHLQGPEHARAAAVLTRAAQMAGWADEVAPPVGEGLGRGIAYARYKNTGAYCAVVVRLRVDERVRLEQIWIAADLGLVVHADGARNQLEGGAIQAASWTLCEQARVDAHGVASNDWERYPILRFSEVPPVQVALIAQPEQPSLGAGECTAGPTAAAIANAVAQATGLRMRTMPFTPDNLMRQALA
ncbi:MAG: xanthine dehydrogenase family protein molybdopterin-binding subunit [Rhodoferax sp.]|nr:xanthine dehydrogenase family protein molybdopterin-binding subunit [Rhodoferax sp.]